MNISSEDVRHVARLARLELTEQEVDRFTVELGVILTHASRIGELDLSELEPTAHPAKLQNVWRHDQFRPGIAPDVALANAPEAEENMFRVPRILELEEEE